MTVRLASFATVATVIGLVAARAEPVLLLVSLATGIVVAANVWDRPRGFLGPTGPLLAVVVTSATLPAWLGKFQETPISAISHSDYTRAATGLALFVAVGIATYFALKVAATTPTTTAPLIAGPPRNFAIWFWFAALGAALVALFLAAQFAGGLAPYIAGLANRRVALEGQGWVSWALVAPATASLLVIASYRNAQHDGRAVVVNALVVALSFLIVLGTGNRMNTVAYAAELAVVTHLFVRRLQFRHVATGVIAIAALGLALPSLLRPPEDEGSLRLRSLADSYADLDRRGPISDFGQLAGAAMVMAPDSPLERQYGLTYLASLTFPLPRAIAPWKLPDAGEVATERLAPAYWYGAGTGFQVSAIGEGYMNFGWLGVGLAGTAFGIGLAVLSRMLRRSTAKHALLYAVLLPRVALYTRGGFANVTAFALMEISVLLVGLWVLRRTHAPRPLAVG